jgi:hypothetical protein
MNISQKIASINKNLQKTHQNTVFCGLNGKYHVKIDQSERRRIDFLGVANGEGWVMD